MVHFRGTESNEDARMLIQDLHIGGIIYYKWANGLHSPEQVGLLSQGLQQLAKKAAPFIPLLIAIDQEGGRVTRLTDGFTQFPGNKSVGDTNDPERAKQVALVMGKEMRAVGITMNLAPVVDINSNPKNPIIGTRSFGDTAAIVTSFGKKALEGYAEAHVLTTLKHFPGHGDVNVDSHHELPVVTKTLQELEHNELIPFTALAKSSDAIMTAHILATALDQDHPTTLSLRSIDYLRNRIGFQGAIISDSLVMDGILKRCHTVDAAAIEALLAGHDIILLGGRQLSGEHEDFELTVKDIKRIHAALVNACQQGLIPKERLDQAVAHVLALKMRYIGK